MEKGSRHKDSEMDRPSLETRLPRTNKQKLYPTWTLYRNYPQWNFGETPRNRPGNLAGGWVRMIARNFKQVWHLYPTKQEIEAYKSLFVWLLVLTGSSQGSQLLHNLLGCNCPFEFVSFHALLDLGFWVHPRLDLSSQLGAPLSWEMSIGTRPCLCSLDTFHHNRSLAISKSSVEWSQHFWYFFL